MEGLRMSHFRVMAMILLLSSGPAMAAEDYQVSLRPVARTNATRFTAVGYGDVKISLEDNKLSIDGNFGGLASPAIDAQLCIGLGIGVEGTCGATGLTVSQAASGNVTGVTLLNAKQQQALRAGQLYIQINSEKSPAPAGNLWGWILIAHETVGPDVPQEGHWFLPQYDMPQSVEHGSTHPLKSNDNS
jgi:hypothetical protein